MPFTQEGVFMSQVGEPLDFCENFYKKLLRSFKTSNFAKY